MSSPSNDRDRVLAELDALAGPLGPFSTSEGREQRKERLIEESPDWLLEGLLSVVTSPPPDGWRWTDVELTVVDLLAGIAGRRDITARLVPLLALPTSRPVVIDTLGAAGDPRAVGWLTRTYDDHALDEDELVRLADALGDLGGDDARALLGRMSSRADLPPKARQEVGLALERSRRA